MSSILNFAKIALNYVLVRIIARHLGSVVFCLVIATIMAGAGSSLGVDNLFQDSQHLVDRAVTDGIGVFRNSPSLLTSLALYYVAFLVVLYARSSWQIAVGAGGRLSDRLLHVLLQNSVPAIILYAAWMAIWLYPGRDAFGACTAELVEAACGGKFRNNDRVPYLLGYEPVRLAIGFSVGVAVSILTLGMVRLVAWIFRRLQVRSRLKAIRGTKLPGGGGSSFGRGFRLLRANRQVYEYVLSVLLTGAPVFVLFWYSTLIPAIALFGLLATILITVSVFFDLNVWWRYGAIAVLAGFLIVPTHDRFKVTFDGILQPNGESYYRKDQHLLLPVRSDDQPDPRLVESCTDAGAQFEAVDPLASLAAWKIRQERQFGHDRPKLVLVTTSGGAYRSAYWTAMVLERLAAVSSTGQVLEGFTSSVRVITGASGGMIGAAYFTAMSEPFGADEPVVNPWAQYDAYAKIFTEYKPLYRPPQISIAARINDDIWQSQRDVDNVTDGNVYRTRYPIPRDTLSPVTQHLLQKDLISILLPARVELDRGKVLERQWITLSKSFKSMSLGEAEGWRPSMIFSPTVVETGQPLIISNLDLSFLPRIGKKEALTFFDLFPCSQGTFNLATAARMNATFPFISPAVSLPTIPERRIVDAGYYDNYGVSLAAAFLSDREISQWILENTSGVIVLQLRAFPLRTGAEDPCVEPGTEPDQGALEAFEWLTSPVEAVVSARGSTMVFRNEQELRSAKRNYPEGFIKDLIFTNSTDVSMNWALPEDEAKAMRACLEEQWNPKLRELAGEWATVRSGAKRPGAAGK